MKRTITIIAVLLALLTCAGFAIRTHERGMLNSRGRAEHEHGVTLPQSAHNIRCVGDAWHGVMDRGATAMFEIDCVELSEFLARLDLRPGLAVGCPSGYGTPPATWGGMNTQLNCASPVGDWLNVAVYEFSSNTVGIQMYTDWN